MNRTEASLENLQWLIEEIKGHLRLVNASLIQADDYDLQDYLELYDLYALIEKKQGKLTMMEIEGILDELRELKR